jgi:FkbM family methyltransferase
MNFETRLLEALREVPGDGAFRRRHLAGELLGQGRERVLFGAGTLGRRTQATLRALGFSVPAFADNGPDRWGSDLDGTPVLSPGEALRRYGHDHAFLVTIWRAQGGHSFLETQQALRAGGAERVAHFGHLAWAHPEAFLPYYSMDRPEKVLEAADSLRRALELLGDARSRETFARQALWRLDLDFGAVSQADPEAIYFDPALMPPRGNEVLVDGGAYDGDTIAEARIRWGGGLSAVHAFEPDPVNVARFHRRFEAETGGCPVHVQAVALSDHAGLLRFAAEGQLSSASAPEGALEVPCARLDDLLSGVAPTFLKLDIEGAELEALEGAAELLARHRPRLAVCAYHRQAHLWELPLRLQGLRPGSALHLRSHGTEGWELVLYATD